MRTASCSTMAAMTLLCTGTNRYQHPQHESCHTQNGFWSTLSRPDQSARWYICHVHALDKDTAELHSNATSLLCHHLAGYRRISDKDTGTFKYFVKVVPTEYQSWSGMLCYGSAANGRQHGDSKAPASFVYTRLLL